MEWDFWPITFKVNMSIDEASREERRFRALEELDILDTPPEPEFGEMVELASAICGMPISLISLVAEKRQWFKAVCGIRATETPIEDSFCAYAVRQDDLFLVEDAALDTRFAHTGLVTGEPKIRAYAGVPLRMSDGCIVGTLCVIDVVPRQLTAEQKKTLTVLGRQTVGRIERRSERLSLEKGLHEKTKMAASLQQSETLFRAFMNNSPFLQYIKDTDGRLLFYNEQFAKQLGVTMEEYLGKLDHELWPEEEAREFRKHDLEVLAGGVRVDYEEEVTNRKGELMHFRSTKFPYETVTGKKLLAGIAIDVTQEMMTKADLARYQAELETANIQLRQLSVTDVLTGLKNRRAFDERLAIEFALARRVGRDLSVILIDVDNFKQINDRQGHAAGDDVLRELSRVLERTVRLADLAVRYGGEEFAVLLPDSNLSQAMRCAERFRATLGNVPFPHGIVTVSIGVAANADAQSGLAMVACADEALYAAKRSGKDKVVAYGRHWLAPVGAGKEVMMEIRAKKA